MNATIKLVTAVAVTVCLNTSVWALDVEAAKDLLQQNNCIQCHGIKKDKDAPAFAKIAEKYKGKAGAEEELMKHVTSGRKVKLLDGTQEDHKVLKTMPANDKAQMKNLVQWIMSN
jgi:cytochrome c